MFSQKFDFKSLSRSDLSDLSQKLLTKLSIAKKFEHLREKKLIGRITNSLSVNIVRDNLNVDWNLKDGFHKFKVLSSAFVLKDSSGEEKYLPSTPVLDTRVKNLILIILPC